MTGGGGRGIRVQVPLSSFGGGASKKVLVRGAVDLGTGGEGVGEKKRRGGRSRDEKFVLGLCLRVCLCLCLGQNEEGGWGRMEKNSAHRTFRCFCIITGHF